MTNSTKSFTDFARLQKQVASALSIVADCYEQMEANERAVGLTRSRHALESDTFKVVVVGEFKRGKSTAINAMLGQPILPAKVAPCTAVITRVKYGTEKTATLHHRDDDATTVIDLATDPAALRNHLVIKHTGEESLSEQNQSPYVMAEVSYPLDLLEQQVELVDSPGLNEHAARTAVTQSYLPEADAMVMVLSCAMFLSQSERQFLDNELANRDLKDVFFLCNRHDAVRDSPDELEELQQLANRALLPRVKAEPRLFFVTALDALAGKIEGNPELIEQSNMPLFMSSLEEFLSTERSRVKLTTPVRICEHAIQEGLLNVLPQREMLFRTPLETLREKLETERPRLEQAERQCERAVRGVDRHAEGMVREAQASWRSFVAHLELGVERHAKTIEIKAWDALRSKSATSKKLATDLEDWMGTQMRQWEQQELQPLLETHWRNMVEELDEQADEFLKNLANVRAAFLTSSTDSNTPEDVTAISRLLGAGLGLLNFGAMIEGAALGVGPAAKGLALNLAAVLVLKAMAVTLPVILPVVIGIGVFRTVAGAKKASDAIREHVVKQIVAAVRQASTDTEAAISQQILDTIVPLRQQVQEQMTAMVAEIRNQVTEVIAEREQSQVKIEEELTKLAQIRDTLNDQLNILHQVILELD